MASHGQVRVPVEAVLNGFGIPKMQVSSLVAIVAERQRQDRMLIDGTFRWLCNDPTVDDSKKLGVLLEEVGEVAKAINDFDDADNQAGGMHVAGLLAIRRQQRDELIQVAAVAVAWSETINAELAEFGHEEEEPRHG